MSTPRVPEWESQHVATNLWRDNCSCQHDFCLHNAGRRGCRPQCLRSQHLVLLDCDPIPVHVNECRPVSFLLHVNELAGITQVTALRATLTVQDIGAAHMIISAALAMLARASDQRVAAWVDIAAWSEGRMRMGVRQRPHRSRREVQWLLTCNYGQSGCCFAIGNTCTPWSLHSCPPVARDMGRRVDAVHAHREPACLAGEGTGPQRTIPGWGKTAARLHLCLGVDAEAAPAYLHACDSCVLATPGWTHHGPSSAVHH